MLDKNTESLKTIFGDYYKKNKNRINSPSRLKEREFGYLSFDGFMHRHISVSDFSDFLENIIYKSPKGVYASCSYYNHPAKNMAEKEWKGSDLAFDIDADALNLKCKNQHDHWICKNCGKVGKGSRPNNCTKCKDNKINVLTWSCSNCLGATKNEAIKLFDILVNDFGISQKDISIFFSGNKGYHLVVENSVYEKLDRRERREIVDYMLCKEISLQYLGFDKKFSYSQLIQHIPLSNQPGWPGRIAHFFTDYETGSSADSLNYSEKIAEIYSTKSKSNKIFKQSVMSLRSNIDPSVTPDTSRIFRLPTSLHNKSGFAKIKCGDILSFEPSTQPVVLSSEPLKINITFCPVFTLKGITYGPFKKSTETLPTFASVYLLLHKLATIA